MRFTKPQKVSTLDIRAFTEGNSNDQEQFIDVFGKGLKEYGFVIIEGHGIPSELIQSCYDKSKAFFQLPSETKKLTPSLVVVDSAVTPRWGKSTQKTARIPTSKSFGMWDEKLSLTKKTSTDTPKTFGQIRTWWALKNLSLHSMRSWKLWPPRCFKPPRCIFSSREIRFQT
jgi:isopenicillin N synthase-like dioxygenase